MIVVSDTSAIDALLKIGEAELLPRLFERVIVPDEVLTELAMGRHVIPAWLESQTLPGTSTLSQLAKDLHQGEAAAIALAEIVRPDFFLVDERKARRIAAERGLRILGLAGALAIARKRLMIGDLRVFLHRLKKEARFRLSDVVIDRLCAEFGD